MSEKNAGNCLFIGGQWIAPHSTQRITVISPASEAPCDAEAIRLANDSAYGLGGSVWTRDEKRGIEVAKRVHTGFVLFIGGHETVVNAPGRCPRRAALADQHSSPWAPFAAGNAEPW